VQFATHYASAAGEDRPVMNHTAATVTKTHGTHSIRADKLSYSEL
jgi:hypothetical protein